MARVLVVEDDVQTAAEIAAALGDSGFDVDCAHTGREGLLKAGADTYEAIVLDRMLPGGVDGLTVLSTLRTVGVEAPVLILSALSAVDERVRGLRAGGDDYLTKPFEFLELTARIEVLVRRQAIPQRDTMLHVGDLEIDLLSREAPRRSARRAVAARVPSARVSHAATEPGCDADDAVRRGLGLSLRRTDERDRRAHWQTPPEARRRRLAYADPHRAQLGVCPPCG